MGAQPDEKALRDPVRASVAALLARARAAPREFARWPQERVDEAALASTIDTTLPMPTPMAGVPLEYAARMFACEPVAATRSAWRISS